MSTKIALDGVGGQGVRLIAGVMGALLARMGKEVTVLFDYDSIVRGSMSDAFLIFDDEPIANPVVEEADIMLKLADKGHLRISGRKVVADLGLDVPGAEQIPFASLGSQHFGKELFGNMIALGRILRLAASTGTSRHPRVAAAALRRGERGRDSIRLRPDRRGDRSAGGRRTAEPLPDEHGRDRRDLSEPPDILIRRSEPSDAPQVAELFLRHSAPDTTSRSRTRLTRCAAGSPMTCCRRPRPGSRVDGDELVGFLSLRDGFLDQLYLAPDGPAGASAAGWSSSPSSGVRPASTCSPSRSTTALAASTSVTASPPSGSATGRRTRRGSRTSGTPGAPTERAAVRSADGPTKPVPGSRGDRRAPKVLLHDHLDGGLRPGTVLELASEIGYRELPTTDPDELGRWFTSGADRKSLELYLEGFRHTVAVMQTRDAIERVAAECAEDLSADGVVYAEVRMAPELLTEGGLSLDDAVTAMLDGFRRGSEGRPITMGLIVTAMRQAAKSVEIAELAVRHRDEGVVGFDIAGPEAGYPPTRHLDAFNLIAHENFHFTIHAGEGLRAALDLGGAPMVWCRAPRPWRAHRRRHHGSARRPGGARPAGVLRPRPPRAARDVPDLQCPHRGRTLHRGAPHRPAAPPPLPGHGQHRQPPDERDLAQHRVRDAASRRSASASTTWSG